MYTDPQETFACACEAAGLNPSRWWFTTAETAKIFAVPRRTLAHWGETGRLRRTKLGSQAVRYSRDDIIDFMSRARQGGRPANGTVGANEAATLTVGDIVHVTADERRIAAIALAEDLAPPLDRASLRTQDAGAHVAGALECIEAARRCRLSRAAAEHIAAATAMIRDAGDCLADVLHAQDRIAVRLGGAR